MAGTVHDITESKLAEERLRYLSRRLVEIQEDERRSIARELHDEIGQNLTALKLSIERLGPVETEDSSLHIHNVHETIDELMKKVRELSLELRPRMLDDLGLLPCLLWHFERFKTQTGINIQFEHAGLNRDFNIEISTAAYRIVQEALTNVARHAGVQVVTIRVWTSDDTLYLRIEDRGKGFEPLDITSEQSFGLDTMCERAFLLGGSVTIDASPEVGTCILAELPLFT
jgi:signal transduction histidine kinase